MDSTPPAALARPSLRDLLLTSLRIGCLGFGGPAGQIALMHRLFVNEKRWIDEARYLHALGFCTLLPGPEAQQLATYVGWSLRGVAGGLIAGLMFVLPGAVVILALSWLYAAHGEAPLVAAALTGVKAAVLALVVEALARVGRRVLKGRADLLIAAGAFAALALFGVPFPLVILAAAILGLTRRPGSVGADTGSVAARPRKRDLAITVAIWTVIWLAPLAASAAILGRGHWLTQVGGVFATLAVTSFGGAYALLAWLQQQAVETHGWLEARQMVDGLGLAETTPGPLVLVNQFVGFMAGWGRGGSPGWAVAGAGMALWQTFAPSFLFIFAGAPYSELLRSSRAARGVLAAVMAAVLGVIASLALWFAIHVLFARVGSLATPWGSRLTLPDLTSFDALTAILAVAAGVFLMRFRANVVLVIVACAACGLARGLLT
ncbi:MAG: chromate efflux transporter [Caulobacter sp.]|nr:chromate efflux transporter [Caulobacter sp.]